MDDALKRILEATRKAGSQAEKAEEYRRLEISSLSAKKADISEREIQRARESAAKRSKRAKTECEERLNKVKSTNVLLKKQLEEEFSRNGEIWTDEIVKNVLCSGR